MACEIDEKYILNDRFNNYQLSFKRITINNGEEKTSYKGFGRV